MTSRSRLILACTALVAVLPLATPAFAQAGSGYGCRRCSAGAHGGSGSRRSGAAAAEPAPTGGADGCPYRDGKLELIV